MAGRHHASTDFATEESHSAFPSGCLLYVAEGNPADVGRHILLDRGRITIGTSDDCDLQLSDERVSRRHAEFAIEHTGVAVRDLGSTNGVHHLGSRIGSAVVKPGARLRLGRTVVALVPRSNQDAEVGEDTRYGDLIGNSIAMRKLFDMLKRIEGTELPVLISGETGCGKEMVARAIHERSPRQGMPFVVLDCAAINQELAESELFGHVRGAFTGAEAARPGIFEQAESGTVFIDEIGELPLGLQPRLLRVLETGHVKRVGGNAYIPVDTRVLAATHRKLREMSDTGEFRGDLYYRLAVVTVDIPPLRQREGDIPLLAEEFVRQLSPANEPGEALLTSLSGHHWPGNVRELRNAVHRLVTMGLEPESERLNRFEESTASVSVDTSRPYKDNRERIINRFEAQYIKALLVEHGQNVSAAARAAGIARSYFRTLMSKHGLS